MLGRNDHILNVCETYVSLLGIAGYYSQRSLQFT